jgi:Tfp pilus assembly protein FimV
MGSIMKSTEQNAQAPTEIVVTAEKKARASTAVVAKKTAVKTTAVKTTAVAAKKVKADAAVVAKAKRLNQPVEVVPAVTVKAPIKAKSVSKPKAAESVAVAVKAKVKKDVLVRDSFTMPQSEYQVLSLVKKACLQDGIEIKKSELLRIAVVQLAGLSVRKIASLQKGLNKIQAGRPKK